jgi:L-fuconolactonase
MLGSDWPVCLLTTDYGRTVALVRDAVAGLPVADQRAILWNTAARVYCLQDGRL